MERDTKAKGLLIFGPLIGMALILGGCDRLPFTSGKKKAGPSKIVVTRRPPARHPPAKPAETKPKPEKSEPPYVYNPVGKRDPFRPFIAMRAPVKPAEGEVPLSPLQKYDISQLKLVAVMSAGTDTRAMLEDAEGKGYIVKKGTYVGRNFGKVTAIEKSKVIIQERYQDYLGAIRSKEIVLTVHIPEEGEKP